MNTASVTNPLNLDVLAFAKANAQLEARWPLTDLPRLCASFDNTVPTNSWCEVTFAAQGKHLITASGEAQTWIHFTAAARIPLQCQRCLQPVWIDLNLDRRFLFVNGEDVAAQLDTDSEHDVLALTRNLNLCELTEDELLLALPLVPRHDECAPPAASQTVDTVIEESPHPFAALAALKRPNRLN